jgi:pyruvate/2-oxoglutarate dehydrogenase complex dihydrolipoamide acyltransferase (E2) component
MTPIRVETELWATSLLPEGMIEKWLVPDGAFVETGDPLAALRIEGALHELIAPAEGWLTIDRKANDVVEPGAVVGHIGART